jgi:hypothetical protein
MKRQRDETSGYPFKAFKPTICTEDPDLTLKLNRCRLVAEVPQYEFEMRHSYERYSSPFTSQTFRHLMGTCVLRIAPPEHPQIIKAGN